MSFTLATKVSVPPPSERLEILRSTNATVSRIVSDLQANVTTEPPSEWACGLVVGYLRAEGYSWSEALTVMDEYLRVTGQVGRVSPDPIRYNDIKLEAIVCSVGCSAFLKTTLARNMRHFDRTLVVTDEQDMESRAVAQSMGADVMVSNRFYGGGRRFDRGSVYNRALRELRYRDWVTFMDVDIVLSDYFRAQVQTFGLKQDVFYGIPRHEIHGDDNRAAFLRGEPFESAPHQADDWGFGYFQMFCMKSRFIQGADPIYPGAEDCNHSDYLFRKQFGSSHAFDEATGLWSWDPVYQVRLPFHCYHIGSNGDGTPSLTRHYPNPHNVIPLSCPPTPVAASSPSLPPPVLLVPDSSPSPLSPAAATPTGSTPSSTNEKSPLSS